MAQPIRPGTAPYPHRSPTVDNIVIYGGATVCIRRGYGVATAGAWTILLAAVYPSSGAPQCPFSQVQTGCRSLAGGAGGAGGRDARPVLAAGAILGARFRPALALLVGPGQPAPLPLVHVHAPAAAELLLAPRFKSFSLFFREIYAYLHCLGTLAKPCAKRQTEKGVVADAVALAEGFDLDDGGAHPLKAESRK